MRVLSELLPYSRNGTVLPLSQDMLVISYDSRSQVAFADTSIHLLLLIPIDVDLSIQTHLGNIYTASIRRLSDPIDVTITHVHVQCPSNANKKSSIFSKSSLSFHGTSF